jgi:hypothetical protein
MNPLELLDPCTIVHNNAQCRKTRWIGIKTTDKRRTVRRRPATAETTNRSRPARDFNLTAEKRALLPDPSRVIDTNADAIIGMRRERSDKPVTLDKVLKGYGYRVEGYFLPSASSELDQLTDSVLEQAVQNIEDLAEDPFSVGYIPLRGHHHLYVGFASVGTSIESSIEFQKSSGGYWSCEKDGAGLDTCVIECATVISSGQGTRRACEIALKKEEHESHTDTFDLRSSNIYSIVRRIDRLRGG